MAATTDGENPSKKSSDVFSMTDDALASRYKFEKENGVGNWGSVWVGFDKRSASEESDQRKVALKVVHRQKTQTTAARVRALWNEMKVVHPFKDEGGHVSIVNFDCFIITPSYALIVMNFLPSLLPVKVEESTAKGWFASLASAVEFMHLRGVVHNDIKPANILLSSTGIPTFVDFGFSERYDLHSSSPAFRSSLAYGTPEYLSPERARGLTHDPRKSDIWSLGVTFFEIMTGRTPFEHEHGEQFTSKEELEVYWSRTMKGLWVGKEEGWREVMSRELESLLRKMLEPNADVRITAEEMMKDSYWTSSAGHNVQKCVSATLVASGTAQFKISSAVRTILGDRQNVPTSEGLDTKVGLQSVLRYASEDENGSGKENRPPRLRKQPIKSKAVASPPRFEQNTAPSKSMDQRKAKSSLPAAQEAARVQEVAADTRVDRMAIWVKNVEKVVQDAKVTFTRDNSQLLPYVPSLRPDQPPQSSSPFARPRANEIFVPISNDTTTRAVGNTADLSAPQSLRHAISANYPFNAGSIDGVGQKVVVNGLTKEVRRTRSDLVTSQSNRPSSAQGRINPSHKCHKKSPSYNSMYLGHSRMTSVPVIPEVRVEDVDDPNRSKTIQADVMDSEAYYEQLLAGSNAVERVGKGYQSNVCTRNDSTTQKTTLPSVNPVKRLPPSSFFMTVREHHNTARPQRKMRQAASFDGFANIRPRTYQSMATRPVSANLDVDASKVTAATPMPIGKKRSSVTGTMKKAFLALLGGDKLGRSA